MRCSKLTSMLLLYMCLAGLSSLSAQAQLVQLTDATQLNPLDAVTPDFPGNIGEDIAAPFSLMVGSNTVTFTALNGVTLYRVDAAGAFDPPLGSSLVLTEDVTSTADGPLRLDFNQPIAEFGLRAQNAALDFETFTFSVFSGATLLATFTSPTVDNTFGTGASIFLGAQQMGTPSITSITVSSTSTVAGGANFFAVGPVTFGPAAVPEPGSVALLAGMGVSGAGFLSRRRKQARLAV